MAQGETQSVWLSHPAVPCSTPNTRWDHKHSTQNTRISDQTSPGSIGVRCNLHITASTPFVHHNMGQISCPAATGVTPAPSGSSGSVHEPSLTLTHHPVVDTTTATEPIGPCKNAACSAGLLHARLLSHALNVHCTSQPPAGVHAASVMSSVEYPREA